MTLLLAFFVVMYAISSVNAGKYRVLSDSLLLRSANSAHHATHPGWRQAGGTGADMNTTIVQQAMLDGKAQSHLAPVPVANGLPKSGGNSMVAGQLLPPQAAAAAAALSRMQTKLRTRWISSSGKTW